MRILHVPRHERVATVRYGRMERFVEAPVRGGLDPWRLAVPVTAEPRAEGDEEKDSSSDQVTADRGEQPIRAA
ncbi:MAG: hypothetical protein EP330_21585 [Deltaproteobacteria bacterium]|nr:MAG: hypothetical protein EP330_21585 [Deltaproteobacteria bacterium]